MDWLHLTNGKIYDPANGIDGVVGDLWIADGKIRAQPSNPDNLTIKRYDLSGTIVMPGGVDMHSHIAGPKVNVARKLRPEDRRDSAPHRRTNILRSGTGGSTPSTFTTGYLYAGLGYTTAFDAAIPPLGARHTLEEFHDTPIIDKGFFLLVGNHLYALEQIAKNQPEKLQAFCAWLLNSAKGYALKCVNPGGVENWKQARSNDTGLDDNVGGWTLTPRMILRELSQVANRLQLPHALHVHCNRLGLPGNWQTTLESFRAVESQRAHFTHIQFHSYAGTLIDQSTFASAVPTLAEYINTHPNLTVDVGQVMFGETTSMTGDGPLGHYLHQVTGRKWFNGDTECEAGCGIVPITYHNKSLVNALQWAIGLEWYLLVKNPWQIAMSTDHPNGGSFLAYPEIIALLMSQDYRQEALKNVPDSLRNKSSIFDLEREYTFSEIAIVTRAAPARMLGLKHKGHLGIGADADITVYTPSENIREMFEIPRYVFKAGQLIVEHGEIRQVTFGSILNVQPTYDTQVNPDFRDWFERHYSMAYANYPITDEYLLQGEVTVS